MSSSIISSCSIVSELVSFSLSDVYNLVSITPFAGHMKWHSDLWNWKCILKESFKLKNFF